MLVGAVFVVAGCMSAYLWHTWTVTKDIRPYAVSPGESLDIGERLKRLDEALAPADFAALCLLFVSGGTVYHVIRKGLRGRLGLMFAWVLVMAAASPGWYFYISLIGLRLRWSAD